MHRPELYARWGADGKLAALIATGPVATDEQAPPPAERTPEDQTFDPPEGGVRFRIPVVVLEGWETSDHRYIEAGSLGRRDLPQTLMAMRRNPDGGFMGHDAAIIAGRIDVLERYDASEELNRETGQPYGPGVFAWRAEGWMIQDTDEAASTLGYVRDKVLRGVSVDLGEVDGELEVLEEDEEGYPTKVRERVTSGSIAQATVCPFAAFPGAFIELVDEEPLADEELPALAAAGQPGVMRITGDDCAPCAAGRPALTASGGPEAPPAAWFARPEPDELTPWTVLPTGEAFGHLAGYDTCHTGVGNACVTAPRDADGSYGLFHTGAVLTAEGTQVAVGHITTGGGHADVRMGIAPAIQHYDDSGSATADVVAVDGKHGIWLSGAVRPEATEAQVRTLRAHALSGDWRRDARGGPLRLVAALSVNTPGFPIPRARVASGVPQALVAAGARPVALRAAAGRSNGELLDEVRQAFRNERRGSRLLAELTR